jgi:hypothetical protein
MAGSARVVRALAGAAVSVSSEIRRSSRPWRIGAPRHFQPAICSQMRTNHLDSRKSEIVRQNHNISALFRQLVVSDACCLFDFVAITPKQGRNRFIVHAIPVGKVDNGAGADANKNPERAIDHSKPNIRCVTIVRLKLRVVPQRHTDNLWDRKSQLNAGRAGSVGPRSSRRGISPCSATSIRTDIVEIRARSGRTRSETKNPAGAPTAFAWMLNQARASDQYYASIRSGAPDWNYRACFWVGLPSFALSGRHHHLT